MTRLALFCAHWLILVLVAAGQQVYARDSGQYANVDPAIRRWYETRQLTPEAEKRFYFKSCCAAADVVKTQFRVDRTTGVDAWQWLKGDKWEVVPLDIIHWNEPTPTGEAVLFAVSGQPVCFFPPSGGI